MPEQIKQVWEPEECQEEPEESQWVFSSWTVAHFCCEEIRTMLRGAWTNTVNLSSTGDLLLRWKKQVNHLNKILKALLWQKGLGRWQIALLGFMPVVDLLDFNTIDAQET